MIVSAAFIGRPASVMAMSGMDKAQSGCPLRTLYSARPQGTTAGPEPGVVAVRVIERALKEAALIVLCCLQDRFHLGFVERHLGLLLFQHGDLDAI